MVVSHRCLEGKFHGCINLSKHMHKMRLHSRAPCTDRSVKKLTETERTMGLRSFLDKGWVLSSSSDSITKVFEFKDFNEAIGFVTRVALKAESIGHYPELHSSEKRVTVTLSSKEVGGLSTADITLAQFIESIAEKNKVSTPLSKAIRFPRLRVL